MKQLILTLEGFNKKIHLDINKNNSVKNNTQTPNHPANHISLHPFKNSETNIFIHINRKLHTSTPFFPKNPQKH
jgi:hypothetical protein